MQKDKKKNELGVLGEHYGAKRHYEIMNTSFKSYQYRSRERESRGRKVICI